MSKLHRSWGLIICAALVGACGPSTKDVKRARTATYHCEPAQIFNAMLEEMKERRMPLGDADVGAKMIISQFRWHTSGGAPKKKGAAVVEAGDLAIAIEARMVNVDNGWAVAAEPRVLAHVVGSPRGAALERSDADWPAWADSKVEVYMVGLYKRLQSCANPPASP